MVVVMVPVDDDEDTLSVAMVVVVDTLCAPNMWTNNNITTLIINIISMLILSLNSFAAVLLSW